MAGFRGGDMGVPCHQSCPGLSEGLWHDTKRPESFSARQEPMGHREWCLVPECGQLQPSTGWSPPKWGSALSTRSLAPPTCPGGLLRLTAGLPEVSQGEASFLWGDGWRQPALER